MMFRFFRRKPQDASIHRLYGAIVAQARAAPFYSIYGVPDTVNGRFEMMVLHIVLVLRRLEGGPNELRALGQGLFDRFCEDMDGNLREMGVGDLAVPTRMRGIGEAFFGRQAAYTEALSRPGLEHLAAAFARNIFECEGAGARRLAAYARAAASLLAEHSREALGRAELRFPDPEGVATADATPRADHATSADHAK